MWKDAFISKKALYSISWDLCQQTSLFSRDFFLRFQELLA